MLNTNIKAAMRTSEMRQFPARTGSARQLAPTTQRDSNVSAAVLSLCRTNALTSPLIHAQDAKPLLLCAQLPFLLKLLFIVGNITLHNMTSDHLFRTL